MMEERSNIVSRSRHPRGRWIAIAMAIAVSACVGTPTQTPKPTKPNRATAGSPAPGESPGSTPASTPPSSSPQPASSVSPSPSAGPSTSPSASPSISPSASPSPTTKLTAAHQALVPTISEKLLTLSKLGFAQARSSLVSNNGSGVVSQNGAGLVSNHGAGVISNNGSNLVGATTYRLLQAAPPTTIALEPQTGETLVSDRHWPDGRRTRWFAEAFANNLENYRTANVESNGQGVYQFSQKLLTSDANGKTYDKRVLRLFQDGSFNEYSRYTSVFDAQSVLNKLTYAAGESQFRDAKLGIALDIDALEFDLVAKTGSFTYKYVTLGLTESGTLANVNRINNKVVIETYDPLAFYDGESQVKNAAGTLLFTKRQTTVGNLKQREYDLGDGLKLVMSKTSAERFEGELRVNGAVEGTARLETHSDGSVLIQVSFAEDPENPLKVGYGLLTGATTPPVVTPRPVWTVKTVAGGNLAAYQDGPGGTARFADPTGIAASQKTPGRFYIADKNNNRIRTMDVASDGSVTIGTYAGDGTAGNTDGPRLSARFFRPYGIVVAPDETVYVTDLGNHRLRKIAPDGAVSLVAGSAKGHADGQGAAAAFDIPTGIARGADGTLYVLDQGTSCLRAIAPDGTVSTLAGLASAHGHVDGQGAAARFHYPIGLTMGPDGNLYVADMNLRYIRKVTPGGLVSTVVGSGVTAKAHLDGDPLQGGISLPYSVCFGPDGTLYIGSYNVRYLTTDGKLKTYAGDTLDGYKDGTNDASQFNNIFGMTMTDKGVLYLIEGQRVRAIVPPATP